MTLEDHLRTLTPAQLRSVVEFLEEMTDAECSLMVQKSYVGAFESKAPPARENG